MERVTVLSAMNCVPRCGVVWVWLYARDFPRVEMTLDSAAARALAGKLIAAANQADENAVKAGER